jgi:glycosyltransferase involved in cell wall biosynthesis
MSISVTILAKNASETIAKTLQSLSFFPEVLVADTGSTDRTKEIARQFPNVKVIDIPFQGFGKTHNLASSHATHDWVLSVDSDEVVTPNLAQEILALKLDPAQVYRLNRQNYLNGKWIRCCSGWYPDRIVRLYHRSHTQFNEVAVHESISSDHLHIVPLQGDLLHTPYLSVESFLAKMQLYSTLFAQQNKGKKSSLGKAIGHGLAAFLKNYFLKRGFLGGKEGFIISLYNAHVTYYKYLKLADLFREKQPRE